ncbi:response regulator [Dysgonomonas sp. 521]|uniref:hybrid sensor histidine kinase/response regulator transcription factor n=1 Tax=Dysgonomonas sp. 521 TaxID=2302932 RepID=UPI0013D5D0C3|nr:substrate-binding domain-containing protein [Dysgonomonas sp. 521]NDV96874.1 response regulator [Dysgonomonas sp. 521]
MRIPPYICYIFIVLFLLSCHPDKKSNYVIGVSQCSDDLWRETVNNEMLREASFFQGTKLVIKTVKDDTQQQIKDLESFIAAGVDLLVVSPNESAAITPVIQKAMQQGIPVILLDRKIDTEDYTTYVGGDNYQIGYEVGLYAAEHLKGAGNVVEIRGWEGSTADKDRHNGFITAIQKYPDIKIIAERRGDFLKDVAQEQMAQVLREESHIDLVFAMNDPMALGVHDAALKYSGKMPFIIGIDALPGEGGGIQNIQKGLMDASFMYPTGGDKVIDLAMKILSGQPFEKQNILYTAVVDRSNARVIQLQTDQIYAHQGKLETMNGMLNQSMTQYSNQRTLLYAILLILLLIIVLLVFSIKAYRTKSRTNAQLERQNKEIKHQAEVLAEQKEQLIFLSKQLEEATHAKLVFFTNISHEFRTPLTLILGPVETLLNSGTLATEQKELLDLVKRNSNSLLGLISQVIEFRTYENGKMRVYLSNSDLKQFLEDLNIVFSDYAKRRQVDFSFSSDNSSFNMWFDKEKVEKIYFNLLSNAFKHTERAGEIRVSLNKEIVDNKDYARLSVFNTGKEIPKDKINSIFDRFYKVNPHDAGTGIGLAFTSALVDVHQGKISVDSEDGKGTTFTVLLPFGHIEGDMIEDDNTYESGYTQSLIGIEPSASSDDLLLNSTTDTDKPMVLLVEDNVDMRSYMLHILQNDYTVLQAEDGEIGVEKAIKFIPDVVISDVMMPGKDGFEVCNILKENVSTSHIPVILLTACSLDEQKAIGFESGADAYIPKPFNAELLKIRLRKLIENRQKIKQTFSNSLINDTKKTTLGDMEQAFMNNFKNYIELNISDPDLNVDEIARNMGLSRVQLYRKIKQLTDYSPVELIKIIRLKYAVELLNVKSKTMSEVAYEAGFSSPSYFTKCFKEFYKENPSDYIKRISEGFV